MFKEITSLQNDNIKKIVALRDRKDRKKNDLTLVEGLREIRQALDARIFFKEVYFCKELLKDQKLLNNFSKETEIFSLPKFVFSKIAYGDRLEGILGVCQIQLKNLNDIKISNKPIFLVIESVEKPGNLGAILRSADASGVDAVIVSDPKTDIYNPNVIRSSIGTIFSNTVIVSNNEEVLKFLRNHKCQILCASPNGKLNYFDCDYSNPTAIIVGSEEKGLSSFWLDNADKLILIPMKGKVDSLNVSTSAAVLLYEVLRQRQ